MRQLIVVPLYHLSTMYNLDKIFKPLDNFLDLPTLLEMCFNSTSESYKMDIWNVIEQKRSAFIFNTVSQNGRTIDEMFDDDESFLYEVLDVMIDMFIEISYKILSSYVDLDLERNLDYIRSFRVSNDSVYVLIEK